MRIVMFVSDLESAFAETNALLFDVQSDQVGIGMMYSGLLSSIQHIRYEVRFFRSVEYYKSIIHFLVSPERNPAWVYLGSG